MKYPVIISSALTSLCLLASHSSVAAQSNDSSDDQARWFEIEVILFKHVTDNSASNEKNSEQFSAIDLSSKKRNALDLLAPYLQPDIASLKKLLPNCEQAAPIFPYHITPTRLWTDEQSSDGITQSAHAGGTDIEGTGIEGSDTQATHTQDTSAEHVNATRANIKSNRASDSVTNESLHLATRQLLTEPLTEPAVETNAETQSKIYTASSIELPVYNRYPITNQTPLCVIPDQFFQQHLTLAQLERFAIDGFAIENMPKSTDGLEQWQDDDDGQITWASDEPYLLSNDSLRLHSIVERIKWSRDYAPLLHLGWRQTGESSRQATAVQLYAGEHLELTYQQAQVKKEAEQLALEIQEILTKREQDQALINQPLSVVSPEENNAAVNESALSITQQLHLQAQQQQLNSLYEQFTLLTSQLIDPVIEQSTDPLINKPTSPKNNDVNDELNTFETIQNDRAIKAIVAQLSTDITAQAAPLSLKSGPSSAFSNSANSQVTISKPLQPWSVDGLFTVHLDHYLYINTEFNIIDTSARSKSTSALTAKQKQANENEVISFKQDRRVITGEIHYFDHPDIGMVVQIRRFDPSAPADEAVTQSKK
ncbi:CsiV family protein [Colwellia ponticola]|uniref:Uncharacterized protein n=1 Tax=Colwellia ponticola TaxID=2304625 RepID=A0A8H2PNC0_9GAMM|nr:CsiV family protein [Colwellia ponticola]TMM46355.1 hypothetical protein FCS21_05175 [Colwellia ponticola]